jgi:dTDP-4-amino-4,6-dideoxygalactose transaminase
MVGAIPVLVEVDPETYCLDPSTLEAALSASSKAILPVHLYGHPADLHRIGLFARQHGLAVVEDCAQAQGAMIERQPVGGIADMGCFSFYPTKNLAAIGDGGMVVSKHPDLVDRLRRLRTYGWSKSQFAEIAEGRCSRLDELQAAILNVKLGSLAADLERRRSIAREYNAALADLPLVLPHEKRGCRHAYHLFVVRCDERDALARHLDCAGIGTAIHYPFPVHAQPGLALGSRIPQPLMLTEKLVGEILTLPLYPSMPEVDQARVIEEVRSFFSAA